VTELAALRSAQTVCTQQALTANPLALPLPAGARCDGELTLERRASATIRFELAGVVVTLDASGVRFNDRPIVPLAPDAGPLRLRWLLDRSLLELFVQDRASFTHVAPFPFAPLARVSATGGPAQLTTGSVWTLRSAPAESRAGL
jgi:hypothetical protein